MVRRDFFKNLVNNYIVSQYRLEKFVRSASYEFNKKGCYCRINNIVLEGQPPFFIEEYLFCQWYASWFWFTVEGNSVSCKYNQIYTICCRANTSICFCRTDTCLCILQYPGIHRILYVKDKLKTFLPFIQIHVKPIYIISERVAGKCFLAF